MGVGLFGLRRAQLGVGSGVGRREVGPSRLHSQGSAGAALCGRCLVVWMSGWVWCGAWWWWHMRRGGWVRSARVVFESLEDEMARSGLKWGWTALVCARKRISTHAPNPNCTMQEDNTAHTHNHHVHCHLHRKPFCAGPPPSPFHSSTQASSFPSEVQHAAASHHPHRGGQRPPPPPQPRGAGLCAHRQEQQVRRSSNGCIHPSPFSLHPPIHPPTHPQNPDAPAPPR